MWRADEVIYFLSTAKHQYTLRRHLRSFGAGLRGMIRLVSYEQLFRSWRLPRGVYIFSDIERLWPDEAEQAAKFCQVMQERGGFHILNHPTRSMRRYDLLRTLFVRGSNRFNVYRLTEHRQPEKYPVYVRGENDHNGSVTELLNNANELAVAVAQLEKAGRSRENLLITEFCDVVDRAGLYHKYSAFCVAGTIIPRHLCFAKKWVVKQPAVGELQLLEEERRYLTTNPHEAELQEIFRLARIDYGRMDYAVFDGVIQVWEINTNPMICTAEVACGAARDWIQNDFSAKLQAAFEKLNAGCASSGNVVVNPRDPTRVRKSKTFLQRFQQVLRLNKPR